MGTVLPAAVEVGRVEGGKGDLWGKETVILELEAKERRFCDRLDRVLGLFGGTSLEN